MLVNQILCGKEYKISAYEIFFLSNGQNPNKESDLDLNLWKLK